LRESSEAQTLGVKGLRESSEGYGLEVKGLRVLAEAQTLGVDGLRVLAEGYGLEVKGLRASCDAAHAKLADNQILLEQQVLASKSEVVTKIEAEWKHLLEIKQAVEKDVEGLREENRRLETASRVGEVQTSTLRESLRHLQQQLEQNTQERGELKRSEERFRHKATELQSVEEGILRLRAALEPLDENSRRVLQRFDESHKGQEQVQIWQEERERLKQEIEALRIDSSQEREKLKQQIETLRIDSTLSGSEIKTLRQQLSEKENALKEAVNADERGKLQQELETLRINNSLSSSEIRNLRAQLVDKETALKDAINADLGKNAELRSKMEAVLQMSAKVGEMSSKLDIGAKLDNMSDVRAKQRHLENEILSIDAKLDTILDLSLDQQLDKLLKSKDEASSKPRTELSRIEREEIARDHDFVEHLEQKGYIQASSDAHIKTESFRSPIEQDKMHSGTAGALGQEPSGIQLSQIPEISPAHLVLSPRTDEGSSQESMLSSRYDDATPQRINI